MGFISVQISAKRQLLEMHPWWLGRLKGETGRQWESNAAAHLDSSSPVGQPVRALPGTSTSTTDG